MKSENQSNEVLFQQNLIKNIYPQFSYPKFMWMLNQFPELNFSLGCMFGSFMGDSLGAYVQFSKNLDEISINEAMQMTPGGTFNLRAGQVTDDSEMSFHLLEAIVKYNPNQTLQQQKNELVYNIAKQYVIWRRSKPFDIGITCRTGIQAIQQIILQEKAKTKEQKEKVVKKIHKKINQINIKSQSNGSLMKITPLVFLGTLLSQTSINKEDKYLYKQFVKDQVKLIHSNQLVSISSIHWYATLTQICSRKSNKDLKSIFEKSMQWANQNIPDWAKEVQSINPMQVQLHQGWAKIAWSYGMRYFKKIADSAEQKPDTDIDDYYFKSLVKRMISYGGDTDTNAAIVGGMIGSILGFKKLPKDFLGKMLALDFTNKNLKRGHDRPDFYEPRRVFIKTYQFLQKMLQNRIRQRQQQHRNAKY